MKYTPLTLIALLLILLAQPQAAQADGGDDFGIWSTVGVEKKIDERWRIGGEAEWRTMDEASKTDRCSFGVYGQYKVSSWLKASAGYDLLVDNNYKYSYHTDGTPNKKAHYWGQRHRVNVALTGSYHFGHFGLSLRERWQYTYRHHKSVPERYDFDQEDYDGKPKTYAGKGSNVLRSRLKLDYDIAKTGLEPYASVEVYNGWYIKKVRYTAGLDWSINKHHEVGIYYRLQTLHHDDDEDPDTHILGLSYAFRF